MLYIYIIYIYIYIHIYIYIYTIAIQDKFTLTKFSLPIKFHKELSVLTGFWNFQV